MSALTEATERYARHGVDVESALERALSLPLSIHCWQADDVRGLEQTVSSGGGILATGTYPGRARSGDEMRQDYDFVLSLVPGRHRANLHAMYAEPGSRVDRDELMPEHFGKWMDWAAERKVGLDFNPTYFAHPMADSGFTLGSPDEVVRNFWIRHGKACRGIASAMSALPGAGGECILNHWTPDGAKDATVDRWGPRERMAASYDEILADPTSGSTDSLESKLFGLGSEDYVAGSFEFCSHYSMRRGILFCLDMGHFHPTETVADKLSALLQFHPRLLLHASRPMRWDSDHVVLFNDDLRAVFHELARGAAFDRVSLALDYFDASINRIAAYVIGIRSVRKAVLYALLEPSTKLQSLEAEGDGAGKLALLEAMKTLPFGAIWDELCRRANVPTDEAWIADVKGYESAVLSHRT